MKPSANKAKKLAILGGDAEFPQHIHVGRPNIGNRARLLERVNQALDRRYLSNSGPFEQEFERRLCEMLDVSYCVAVSNGTLGLELAIRALNLSGEVIVPSFTFVATVHALQWHQITPVFCDIDPETHNIDPRKIARLITPRTTAILAVHLWGRPCPIDELEAIANSRGLVLLFDAAHALGCEYNNRKIGNFGRAEVLSFHATKFVNAGEGGAVVTNDADLAARMQLTKNFGFAGHDNVICLGTNAKMSEFSAALGLTNLESQADFIRHNRANFEVYEANLCGIRGLSLLPYDQRDAPNYQYVVLEVDAAEVGLTRDQLVSVLHAENVLARRYFYPGVHRMEPYRSQRPDAGSSLPHTEAVAGRVLHLPTGTELNAPDIDRICAIIRLAVDQSNRIRDTLEHLES